MARKKAPENTAELSKEHDAVCAYLCADSTRERLAKHLFETHGPADKTLQEEVWLDLEGKRVFKHSDMWYRDRFADTPYTGPEPVLADEQLISRNLSVSVEYPISQQRGKYAGVVGYADIYAILYITTTHRKHEIPFLFEVKTGAFSSGDVLRQVRRYKEAWRSSQSLNGPYPEFWYLIAPVIDLGTAAHIAKSGVLSLLVGEEYKTWRDLYKVQDLASI